MNYEQKLFDTVQFTHSGKKAIWHWSRIAMTPGKAAGTAVPKIARTRLVA
jgi:hypothetical protein